MNEVLKTEDLLENEILTKLDLMDYDIGRSYYRVIKFMSNYKKLKCKSFNEVPIKITTTYKYIYVDERTKGINDYTQIDQYIDNDTEFKRLSKTIVLITQNMSQDEIVYYTVCLYQGKSEYRCTQEIGCSNTGLIPIKNSCIIKFACAFNLEVYKDTGFEDENEENDYQNFIKEFKA